MRKLKLSLLIFSLIILISLGGICLVLFARIDTNKKIITTNFAIYDICREIMGDDKDILLLGDGVDMHGYQPTAHDIVNIANGELFIHIGGEGEEWVEDVIKTSQNEDMAVLSLINHVQLICNDDHHHEDEHHNHNHTYDEHIWLSIKNMIKMTDVIYSALINNYSLDVEKLSTNKDNYISKLNKLEAEYSQFFENFDNTIIIADRFPFAYLFSDYDIEYYSLFTGCSAETEASPETVATFINKINSLDVDYIFKLETSNDNNAKKIINNSDCKDGVEILTINSIQAISRNNISSASYIDIMRENLNTFRKVS